MNKTSTEVKSTQPKFDQFRLTGHALTALCAVLKGAVGRPAAKFVRPAITGNATAARMLSATVCNFHCGDMVGVLWRNCAPVESFRAYLRGAWGRDPKAVIAAARTRKHLREWFQYAQFPTSDLPETVKVWRGTSGLPKFRAAKGYYWTTNRDVACYFAMRSADMFGRPLLLSAAVPRESVLLYGTDRDEQEVVLFDAPTPEIDGVESEWQERYLAVYVAETEKWDRQRH